MKTPLVSPRRRSAFTLIELLVVVSIIALLVSILLPSLNKARQQAYAVKCATNLRSVGQALAMYTSAYDAYPASYLYPYDWQGNVNVEHQAPSPPPPFGYLHWSYFLYEGAGTDASAFECPSMRNGGAPRTNPGPEARDWENNQRDDLGNSQPNSITDKQAPRMAYTANAAIIPRNKMTRVQSGGLRVNRFVRSTVLRRPGELIVATEFVANWEALAVQHSGGLLSKSHRPVLPFSHYGTGYARNAVYNAGVNTAGWCYGDPYAADYGLLPYEQVLKSSDLLDGSAGHPINSVGRHHPGGPGGDMGGRANFLFADSHVETLHVLETMERKLWGDRFYSINGVNDVIY